MFEKGEGNYPDALSYYLKAQEFNPENARLNYKIGVCYFETNKKGKAGKYLKKAFELEPDIKQDIKFILGKYYHFSGKFDKALDMFQQYRKTLSPSALEEREDLLDKRIKECKEAKKITASPRHVFVDNLGKQINSPYQDYSPVLNAKKDKLYFTSRRSSENNSEIRDEEFGYRENIYIAQKDKEGNWTDVKKPGNPLNTDGHEGIVNVSADGEKLIIYKPEDGGDLYQSKRENDSWSEPEKLSDNINTDHHEFYASLSPNGEKIYYLSDKPAGYGKHDIYVSELDDDGDWSEGENLGASINTSFNEASVFMHPDGKTLYFSSKGHNTIGGYDLFKTEYQDGKWTIPENVGYPINTPGDEVFITMPANENYAYISSERSGGVGSQDIYKITFIEEIKDVINDTEDQLLTFDNVPLEVEVEDKIEVEDIQLVTMKGRIVDQETEEPLKARVILTDNQKNKDITSFTTDPDSGRYVVTLPLGGNYGISVMAEGYLFHSENIDLTNEDMEYKEIRNDIALNKIEAGNRIVLRNIFFDSDKATLRESSRSELNRLYDIMKENQNIRVEISGHTDNVGSASYNNELSRERAKSVVDYLIKKGIDKDRLEYKGYGFRKPIADNDTEEGRQQNRRTEFEIISNE